MKSEDSRKSTVVSSHMQQWQIFGIPDGSQQAGDRIVPHHIGRTNDTDVGYEYDELTDYESFLYPGR